MIPSKTGAVGSTFDDISYTPQAMHDQHVELPRSSEKRPNYRPTSLRWYFVVIQILFIMAAMGIVLWARQSWPDSDSSAVIEHKRSIENQHQADDASSRQSSFLTTVTYISEYTNAGPVITTPPTTGLMYTDTVAQVHAVFREGELKARDDDDNEEDEESSFLTTVTYVSENTADPTTVTVPGTTGWVTTSIVTQVQTVYSSLISGGGDLPSETVYTQTITSFGGEPVTTEVVFTSTEYSLVPGSGTEMVTSAYEVEFTTTSIIPGGDGTTYTTTVTEHIDNDEQQSAGYAFYTSEVPTTIATSVYTTQAASTYIKPGRSTVVAVVTDPDEMPSNIIQPTAEVVDVVSTRAGTTVQVVETVAPSTVVTTDSQGQWVTLTYSGGLVTGYSTIQATTMTYSSTQAVTATPAPGSKVVEVYDITEAEYFIGKFAPAVVAVLISIPLRMMDLNAQLFQPFYALNRPEGAYGSNSMNLHYSGWAGITKPFTTLVDGQPVTFLTMLLVLCSSLMTPLATEAIGVKIHGTCKASSAAGCAAALGVSPLPTHALLALLAFTIVLLCILLYYLRNFETGLYANPWSIAGIASLAANRDVRPTQVTERKIFKEMRDNHYRLGFFHIGPSQTEYGILIDNSINEPYSMEQRQQMSHGRPRKGNPFLALGVPWRALFVSFLLGLFVLILYHHLNITKQSNFKAFIDGQTFGVRFLFSSLGVILSFGWTALFISVATIAPYQKLSHKSQLASDSILLTRPTNGFSGLYSSVKHGQPFLALVAFMTVLSNFMPILLVNIPYTLTQSFQTHVICARVSLGILGLMLLTVFGSFFVRWPDMPVDPRSIAGAMYYISQSSITDRITGAARLKTKQRNDWIKNINGRYWYGEMVTRNGERRMTVELDHAG